MSKTVRTCLICRCSSGSATSRQLLHILVPNAYPPMVMTWSGGDFSLMEVLLPVWVQRLTLVNSLMILQASRDRIMLHVLLEEHLLILLLPPGVLATFGRF